MGRVTDCILSLKSKSSEHFNTESRMAYLTRFDIHSYVQGVPKKVIAEGIPSGKILFGPLKCSWESEVLTIVKYPKADFILGHPEETIEK